MLGLEKGKCDDPVMYVTKSLKVYYKNEYSFGVHKVLTHSMKNLLPYYGFS